MSDENIEKNEGQDVRDIVAETIRAMKESESKNDESEQEQEAYNDTYEPYYGDDFYPDENREEDRSYSRQPEEPKYSQPAQYTPPQVDKQAEYRNNRRLMNMEASLDSMRFNNDIHKEVENCPELKKYVSEAIKLKTQYAKNGAPLNAGDALAWLHGRDNMAELKKKRYQDTSLGSSDIGHNSGRGATPKKPLKDMTAAEILENYGNIPI